MMNHVPQFYLHLPPQMPWLDMALCLSYLVSMTLVVCLVFFEGWFDERILYVPKLVPYSTMHEGNILTFIWLHTPSSSTATAYIALLSTTFHILRWLVVGLFGKCTFLSAIQKNISVKIATSTCLFFPLYLSHVWHKHSQLSAPK